VVWLVAVGMAVAGCAGPPAEEAASASAQLFEGTPPRSLNGFTLGTPRPAILRDCRPMEQEPDRLMCRALGGWVELYSDTVIEVVVVDTLRTDDSLTLDGMWAARWSEMVRDFGRVVSWDTVYRQGPGLPQLALGWGGADRIRRARLFGQVSPEFDGTWYALAIYGIYCAPSRDGQVDFRRCLENQPRWGLRRT
jgi:hypothetical protein